MDDRNTGLTRPRDRATLAVKLLANLGEAGRDEGDQTITVADFIRLTQSGRETHKPGVETGPKELKVTWVKKPKKSDSEK